MSLFTNYLTGNKGLDAKIKAALAKEGIKDNDAIVLEPQSYNKYNVAAKEERTSGDIVFASKGEMIHWNELLLVQQSGAIKDLERQVRFELQEGFISKQKEWGEVKPLIYIADYVYTNVWYRAGYEGRKVIEDYKGERLAAYQIKKKLLLYKYAEYLFFEV